MFAITLGVASGRGVEMIGEHDFNVFANAPLECIRTTMLVIISVVLLQLANILMELILQG